MLNWRNKNHAAQTGRAPEASVTTPDAELVRAARCGDKRAFVEIVARHQAMVCGIALGILGDFAASEDAGQEAFLTAWRKLHELREPERIRQWLAQIARNAALGHLRRTRGHEPLEEALALPDQTPSPDELAADEDEAALVRAFLARLPETYRLPLVLYYRDGQSVRAVAETLGIGEDAVKQRLARGREMLRERMSGMVETVLTRSAPTAIFTMTIAAAIGALATPTAVAASAFATTSLTAGTASSTPLVTAMSTSKTFLVAAAVIAAACIPVGYYFSADHSVHVTSAPVSSSTNAASSAIESKSPTFENSALFAEWRALHEKYGTNSAAMPQLYQAIADLKDPFRRRAFQAALISEWVRLDGPGGLKFYLGKGRDNTQRRQFIEEWLALDPRAATDALLASETGWESVTRDCLEEIARRIPSRLADIVARLPKSDSYWETSVRDAFAVVASSDLASAKKAAEAMTGPNREQSLAGVAQAWAKSDFKSALAWARALPEGTDRDQIIRAALLGVAAVNPAAALESTDLVPPGGKYAHFADTTGAKVLSAASATDFDATIAWLNDHPGRFGREELLGLSHIVAERLNADPAGFLNTYSASSTLSTLVPAIESALLNDAGGQRAAVWEWLKTQPDNEATKNLRNQVLSSAAWQNPELAMRLVDDLPQTAAGDQDIQKLAQNMLNGGNALHRFEKLYDQVPERLRQPLVQAAFDVLGGNLDNPQQWISRLPLLPEAARAKGVESIARAWAMQTPEEAIGWATSLSVGDTRNGAMSTIASTWAAKDAHGAADWIATLSPGAERDRSAESLVLAIADRYPSEAWDWALNINDAAGRTRAATQAVKMMATRDLATARQWIDTGPFTPQDKAQLQATIQQPPKPAR